MALRITIRDDSPPLAVTSCAELDDALQKASEAARKLKLLGAIQIEADNGNFITMVVGGEETVLCFDYGHHDVPYYDVPYYASKGTSDADAPLMNCFLTMHHHTEFPRKYVIPMTDGMKAVRQFLDSGDLPTCVKWTEI